MASGQQRTLGLFGLRKQLGVYRRGLALLSRRDLLAGGIYLNVTPVLWRRVGAQLPDFLRSTKGEEPGSSGFRTRMPILVRGAGGADLVVATFEGGAVYLNRVDHQVTRVYPEGVRADPQHVELRRRFEQHTRAPRASYAPDGGSHVEDYVEGRHLSELPGLAQVDAVGNLLDDYARLTQAEGVSDASAEMLTAVEAGQRLPLPSRLAELASGAARLLPEIRIPWVPSAREANLKNLVVRDDLGVAPIDLGDLTLLPSIWYPLGIIGEAGGEVMAHLRQGSFDDQVAALLGDRALLRHRRDSAWRDQLLAARLIYAAWWDVRAAADSPNSRDLESEIRRRWAALEPQLCSRGQGDLACT